MKNNIFPKEIVENSYEQIVSEYSKSTKSIYLSILIAVIVVIISTFFIKVDIGVTAAGIIKPKGEHVVIAAPYSGKLTRFKWKENDCVNTGDTLFKIWSDNTTVSLPELQNRQTDLENMLADLDVLATGKIPTNFKSLVCLQEYHYYCTLINDLQKKKELNQTVYLREKQLYEKGASSLVEFERCEFDYAQCELELESLKRKQLSQWQSDRLNFQTELNKVLTQIEQISIQDDESVVCAMTQGSVHRILNVKECSYVIAGQQIMEISPDGKLLAECYVASKDIGLVRIGLPVRLRVDAFDYTQWGILSGKVQEIAKDLTVSEQGSYYKVLCSLDNETLSLKNGFTGVVKKGMTINARIVVNRRTIFQQLYDKIDDWINPTVY